MSGSEDDKKRKRDEEDDMFTKESKEDKGHRYGNFHSYYNFHPPSERIDHLTDIFQHMNKKWNKKSSFQYLDLGCNQGDLTIQVSKTLHSTFGSNICFEGIDIDPILIQRANGQWATQTSTTLSLEGTFSVHNIVEYKFPQNSFDLISLFSTTMWIHIHYGDTGLIKLLQGMCRASRKFLIVEPQPSKCYRNALVRLRKMGRPELDISVDKLTWRKDMEDRITQTLAQCGFHRVEFGDSITTKWNRTICLFERKGTV